MKRVTALLVAVLVLGAGCGDDPADPGGDASLGRGVRLELVTLSDMAFTPDRFTARVGERVTYRFVNVGTVRHEAVLGDAARQEAHAAAMRQFEATSSTTAPVGGAGRSRPRVTGRHAVGHPGMTDPFAVLVEPGSSGEITITFDQPGQLLLGCHEPGHWEAGMQATIDVRA